MKGPFKTTSVETARIVAATGSIVVYNQRWYDYTGTTLEEAKEWGWPNLLHPDHVEPVVRKIGRCLETGDRWEETGAPGDLCVTNRRPAGCRATGGRDLQPERLPGPATSGTYRSDIGHTDPPGCFRCHDDEHVTPAGKTITMDCAACHEAIAAEGASPDVFKTLGLAGRITAVQKKIANRPPTLRVAMDLTRDRSNMRSTPQRNIVLARKTRETYRLRVLRSEGARLAARCTVSDRRPVRVRAGSPRDSSSLHTASDGLVLRRGANDVQPNGRGRPRCLA
jgi:hypothetical protein